MLTIPLALLAFAATTYHVDPVHGDDAAPGTSPERAWRTFAPLAKVHLGQGDRLRLAGGTKIAGPLRLDATGGVVVESYGKGRATIDGGAGDGIVVEGGKGVMIRDLAILGAGRRENDGRGLMISRTTGAVARDLDVRGFRVAGIEVTGSRGAVLERVVARGNGAAGIHVSGGYGDVPRSAQIVLRDCKAINNPGDPKNLTNHSGNGIVVGGVDQCVVEYCEAANNGWDMPRKGNGPVGIWAWNASGVVIQDCISHENKSPGTDGGGFDLDGGVVDSVVRRNLSYGNVGAGVLLCQFEGGGPWRGNTVENNVSYEDGIKNFNSGIALFLPQKMTNMAGAFVERNTIVNSRHAVAVMGDVPGTVYRGNVFLSGAETLDVVWGPGGFAGAAFSNNVAWSLNGGFPALGKAAPFHSSEDWRAAGGRFVDPMLRLPKSIADLPTDPRQLAQMTWFRPLPESPLLVRGQMIAGATFVRP